jgi:glutamate formiminotransferase
MVLVSPVNVSEGRPGPALDAILDAARPSTLDVHWDLHHNRSVITVLDPYPLTGAAVARLDIRDHAGAHPRFGVVDVVPFVPFAGSTMDDAVVARDAFVAWLADELGVPSAAYGPDGPSLPELRRDVLPKMASHPTAGVVAVGARGPLVAYNLWVDVDLATARATARAVRSPAVRALGLAVGDRVQVSMNLVDPLVVGPGAAYDAVAAQVPVVGAELVGLVPQAVLEAEPEDRWAQLDLRADRTVEARLRRWSEARGAGS